MDTGNRQDGAELGVSPRATVLRLLWAERGLSRAELARRTGFSRSTISSIVPPLIAQGLVHESREGSSSGGRPPILLGFEDGARVLLGLDIGASHVGAVLTDLRGRVLRRGDERLSTRDHPRRALDTAIRLGRELVGHATAPLHGVGLGLPAPVEPRSRQPDPSIMPAWMQVDPVGEIRSAFGVPVRVENDANLGALAERWWGAGRGNDNVVFVKVATGIGAGIIIDGRIVSGSHGFAGELGHLSIDPNGPPCMCGMNGCLSVLVGTQALLERTRARLPHFPDSPLHHGELDLPALIRAGREGDPLASEIIRFAGDRLGDGLGNLLNLLDPGVLILGGDLTEAGELLLEPVRAAIRRRTLVRRDVDARVVRSRVDHHSVALGAATLILEAALRTWELPLISKEVPA